MDQLAAVLFFLIGFIVWAVIGHFFWLIGRALFRILTGKKEETQIVPRDVSVSQLQRDIRQLYLQGSISQEQLVSISNVVEPEGQPVAESRPRSKLTKKAESRYRNRLLRKLWKRRS